MYCLCICDFYRYLVTQNKLQAIANWKTSLFSSMYTGHLLLNGMLEGLISWVRSLGKVGRQWENKKYMLHFEFYICNHARWTGGRSEA